MTAPITIDQIITSAGTQFRAAMSEENVIDLMDLIERNVPFNTPMRLARFNETLYLTDGFHRMEAFSRLGIEEISADRFTIVDAGSIEEVRTLAAGANVQHGKGNGNADYHNIIKKLMEFGDTYMANTFIPDIEKIAIAIGAARTAVGRGYNNYPKDKPEETLSHICKARRDAALLNQHKKGLSNRKIAELFNMTSTTVDRALDKLLQNPESGKCSTPASPAYLPLANTEDRSDIQQDSSALDDMIAHYAGFDDVEGEEDYVPFTLSEDDEDEAPFDVLAVTGYGEDLARHAKPNTRNEDSSAKKTLSFDNLTDAEFIALVQQEKAKRGITAPI